MSKLWVPGIGTDPGVNLADHLAAKEFAKWLNNLETGLDLIVHGEAEKRELERNLHTMKRLGWVTRDFRVFTSGAVPIGKVQPGKFSW